MSDLIIREDAMGAVQEHFNANGFKGYDDGQKMMDRIKALPSAEAEWIPCSERLPSEDGYYLVTWEDEDGRCTLCDYYAKWLGRFEQEVVAWQPLPTPYKESEVEE